LEARPACGARCRRDRSAKYARARRCVFRACDHLGPVYARASELQICGATPVAGCDRHLPAARAGGAENALCAGNRAIRLLACGNLAREQLEIRRLEALEFAVVGPPAESAVRSFARDAAIGRFHVALEPAVDFPAGGGPEMHIERRKEAARAEAVAERERSVDVEDHELHACGFFAE